jgi:hypothetical protein
VHTIVSIDPGQARDPFAITVLEAYPKANRRSDGDRVFEEWRMDYRIRALERMLGKPYPECVQRVMDILMQLWPGKEDPEKMHLVADITGVGRPIKDYLREEIKARAAGLPLQALSNAWLQIHGGESVETGGGIIRVPKRELVTASVVAMESDRVKLPRGLPLRKEFLEEMRNFRAKININSGHDSYEHWRETDHDDMVLAVAGGIWYAEVFLKPRNRTRKPTLQEELGEIPEPAVRPEPAAGRSPITATPLPPLP